MTSKVFKDKLALITGASRGFGRVIALELAKQGAHVIAVAKRRKGLESLDDEIREIGGQATLVPLDLAKGDGIDHLGLEIYKRWKRLDILVANSGILGPLTPLSHVKPDQWKLVMDINLTANYRLIRSMDALLRSSPAGRVLLITSGATQSKRAYWGPYAVSKAGLEMLGFTYAAETEKTNVRVNLLNPGAMPTLMRAEAFPGEDPKTLDNPEAWAGGVLKLLSPNFDKTGQLFNRNDLETL